MARTFADRGVAVHFVAKSNKSWPAGFAHPIHGLFLDCLEDANRLASGNPVNC
jgi:hypothetical protein